jgi:hypothetical protein
LIKIDESKKLSRYKALSTIPVKNIVDVYKIKKKDNVLIWCDTGFPARKASVRMGKTFYSYLKKIGCNVSIVVGKAYKNPHFADEKINSAVKSLGKGDLFISLGSGQAVYFHKNKKRLVTRDLIEEQGFKMVATNGLMSLNESDISKFFRSFAHDKKKVKTLGVKLKRLFEQTRDVYITCSSGTDLKLKLAKREVINNYGNIARDTNYPVGEVYTAPLEGTAKGVFFVKSSKVLGETILNKKPKKYVVEKGIVTHTSLNKLNDAFEKLEEFNEKSGVKNSYSKVRNVAEFAIGTNNKASLMGVMICDEKVLGTCHIGIGANYHFGGKILCNGHSDHVIDKPNIWFDGKKIMEKGIFLI